MRLFALHAPNGALLLAAGVYDHLLTLWAGARQISISFDPGTAAHRGPECRW